jgi:hypothetical protein
MSKPGAGGRRLFLTESEMSDIAIPIGGIKAPGRRPGEERTRLFENARHRNLAREVGSGAISYFFPP